MAGKLMICPTPIGNLDDMPPRALAALRTADVVCAEDTRVTGKLLAAFDIHTRLERLDENLMGERAAAVVDRVRAGETIAYCSDAGMPGVSDPGQRLVDVALDAGVSVEVLPGPTAVATAYVASGFTCPRFYFGGFFPRKAGERAQVLQTVRALDAVSLYYESPHRIASALADVAAALPLRRVAVCRELTKLHEETVRGLAGDVAAEFAAREEAGGVKGEIVLVIDAPGEQELEQESRDAAASAADRAAQLIAGGKLSRKDIVKKLRDEFGISRNEAYELVHGA
ncbi:MAG: 16S rRNA (cytidine(1402)-2'-O)-methyltransferase [Coriobacteriia bacterium]|nr:16S rRNA (cytidine(1402)-2'-O)-methyltransferase [Coriobacteriia bacterium]